LIFDFSYLIDWHNDAAWVWQCRGTMHFTPAASL